MSKIFRPVFSALPIIGRKKTTFRLPEKELDICVPGQLVQDLVHGCTGKNSLNEVAKSLSDKWDHSQVIEFLGELTSLGVIVDVRDWLSSYWNVSQNPSAYAVAVTNDRIAELEAEAIERHAESSFEAVTHRVSVDGLQEILEARKSTRSFSGESVDEQSLWDILWSGYGETIRGRRTVPSAGALYPLILHVVLLKQTPNYKAGVYRCVFSSAECVSLTKINEEYFQATYSFLDPLMLERAAGVVIISGSFSIAAEKYGNRSVPYALLEAGHVAQNLLLAATSKNIACVEIGGFAAEALSDSLDLPIGYGPMTTIVFGHEAGDESSSVEIEWALPSVDGYSVPFSICLARVSEDINSDWSYGRDAKPSMALTKAISEAKEWAACGCVPELVEGSFDELEGAIDPRSILSFHPSQYRQKDFPFVPFKPNAQYKWVKGNEEMSEGTAFVLADLVYFPYSTGLPLFAYANSSGVAAHPNRHRAVEISILELVERDSFMNMYLGKLITPRIRIESLPIDLQRRIERLERIGFSVVIKDHGLDLTPVAFVFAQHQGLHYTTCASCSSFDPEDAIAHALMEVEASVLARLQNGPAVSVQPSRVRMPLEHGALYEHKAYFKRADFLGVGGEIEYGSFGQMNAKTLPDLYSRLTAKGMRHITVDLELPSEYGGNGDLHIIRSIVPGLVPMTFGFGEIPGGVKRIYEVAKEVENKVLAYGQLTKFPHPFA